MVLFIEKYYTEKPALLVKINYLKLLRLTQKSTIVDEAETDITYLS